MGKLYRKILLLISVVALNLNGQDLPKGYETGDREKIAINKDWKFKLGEPAADYFKVDTDDKNWENVNVPHTLKLTSLNLDDCQDDKTQETFHRDVGWYRKTIEITKGQKNVYLDFEGSHQETTVWVNGQKVGTNSLGGYTPFIYDITKYLKENSPNQITILADNRRNAEIPPDPGPFDFIKFSGLYRDLYIVKTNKIHITSNLDSKNSGITITTPSIDPVNGNATIDIKTQVANQSDKAQEITLLTRIIDAQGQVVLKFKDTQTINSNDKYLFEQIGGLEDNVRFWDIDDPYLYKVNSSVILDGKVIDMKTSPLGLRKFEKVANGSYLLNDKPIKLIGFNRHQHYAYIGDALPNSLHEKDLIQLKRMGMNTVRTAHYPQDDVILQTADRLGILIYEEAPTWIDMRGNQKWFERLMQATRIMIRNHKNHPSVVIWGAGINHRGYVPKLHYTAKQEDPTRLTASQNSRWTGWQTSGMTDIFGNMIYGDTTWGRQEPLLAMEGRRGPEHSAGYHRDPMKSGLIAWTAHAYYSFHKSPYITSKTDSTRSGALTVMRYMKEDSVMWLASEYTKLPYIFVPTQWTKDIDILTVYSNAQKIELILNGKSLGKFIPSQALKYQGLKHPPFEIKINNYEDGKLEVIGINDDQQYCSQTIFTPKKASNIKLIADDSERTFVADGSDIMVVHAQIIDENETVIKDYNGTIELEVSGQASIVGDKTSANSNPAEVVRGVASFLIKATDKTGDIKILAKSEKLKSKKALKLKTTTPPTDNILKRNAYAIYDKDVLRIDLGGQNQLPQFDWENWTGEDNSSVFTKDGVKFTLKPNSKDGVIRWLGEMNVIGKYAFVYGDGALIFSEDGAKLKIQGLEKGAKYTLKTYHHAPASNTNDMDPNLEKLEKESIHKLPYFKEIEVLLNGKSADYAKITSGKNMQYENACTSKINFEANDQNSVEIEYKGKLGKGGIWINGFELIKEYN